MKKTRNFSRVTAAVLFAECPYCGVSARFAADEDSIKVIYCDSDEGGCDKPYVVAWPSSVELEVVSMGVEGYEQDEKSDARIGA